MNDIDPPDRFLVSAAIGWLGLGMFEEGLKELDQVRPDLQDHLQVADVRWQLNCRLGRWDECATIGERLRRVHPDRVESWVHSAYAVRRAAGGGLKAAKKILVVAMEKFPDETIIPYNLACYDCQLGLCEECLCWLSIALKRSPNKTDRRRLIEMALADEDLDPAKTAIRELAETHKL